MKLVVLGLSLSSSWGNGHATTYRALLSAFARRGHEVLFLERDVPWYAANRDLERPVFCRLAYYNSLRGLDVWRGMVAEADAVIVGSYVPEGIEVGRWIQQHARGVTAFYDIDTPVTLSRLERDDCQYLSPELMPGYDVYLSFTGGPTLERIERELGSPAARALYCSVDAEAYRPLEAAACGTPILSDRWDGLDSLFEPGREIVLADTAEDAVTALEQDGAPIGEAARARVLDAHTADHRAAELEDYLAEAGARRSVPHEISAPRGALAGSA